MASRLQSLLSSAMPGVGNVDPYTQNVPPLSSAQVSPFDLLSLQQGMPTGSTAGTFQYQPQAPDGSQPLTNANLKTALAQPLMPANPTSPGGMANIQPATPNVLNYICLLYTSDAADE